MIYRNLNKTLLAGMMLLGASSSYAQSYQFDGSSIGTTLTEGIIETNNTSTNQTLFGKDKVYFGGDTPDQVGNGGNSASLLMTNQYDVPIF